MTNVMGRDPLRHHLRFSTMTRVAALSCVVSIAASGCSSTSAPPAANTTDSALDEDGVVTCQGDPLASTYAPHMRETGKSGVFRFELVSADPAPPAIGANVWVIALTDASGAPVVDATFPPLPEWGSWPNGVRPFMPHHGHPSSGTPQITSNHDGTYSISNVVLVMPGLWQVTINAQAGAQTDSATFGFCVAG